MIQKAIGYSLVLGLAAAAAGCVAPTYDQTALAHDFDGTLTFESSSSQGAIALMDMTGDTTALLTGAAHVKLAYQSNHWSDDREPAFYDQASMVLTVGRAQFTFALADSATGFVDQSLFVGSSVSGQPLLVQLSSNNSVVDTWITQRSSSCYPAGCVNSSCQGSSLDIVTHTKHRRDFTLTIGMPGSTETDFVTGATFTGQEFFTDDQESSGSCS